MTSSQRRGLTRLIIRAAIGFGIGFALQGAIGGAIPPPAIPSSDVHLIVTAVLFALTGAIGGVVIGLSQSRDEEAWVALLDELWESEISPDRGVEWVVCHGDLAIEAAVEIFLPRGEDPALHLAPPQERSGGFGEAISGPEKCGA